MALDVLGRWGFFDWRNCSFTEQEFATSAPLSTEADFCQTRTYSWARSSSTMVCFNRRPATFTLSSSSFVDDHQLTSLFVPDSSSRPFRVSRPRIQACRSSPFETCGRSQSSVLNFCGSCCTSSRRRWYCSRVNGRCSVLGGWTGGALSSESRNVLCDRTRNFSNFLPTCRYPLHQVLCYAQGRKPLGNFLGSQVMEEPWSFVAEGFVCKARQGRRSNVGSLIGEFSRGLLWVWGFHGAYNTPLLRRIEAPRSQPLTSARPRLGTDHDELPHQRIVRNCIPVSHDTPPKRALISSRKISLPKAHKSLSRRVCCSLGDTGIASEKDWGINLKNELISESGINEDGGTWYRESGEDSGDNGYHCRWTVMGGKNAEGSAEWKEAWWEKSDWTGYKELGAEKSGKNAQGDTWWETWQEVLRQDDWSNLARIEKSAQKQAKSGSGSAGWYEKWWEKYNAKGWSEKGAHKYGRLNEQGWWEKWGEQYDGRGAVLKWTDKWAETDMGTKWGDKWEEKFNQGIGNRQGETWHYSANGERFVYFLNRAEPHYGWADAVGNAVQLLAIEALERPPGIYPDLDLGMSQPPQ